MDAGRMKRTSGRTGHVVREVRAPAAPDVVLIAIEGALDARAEATVDPLLDELALAGRRRVVLDCARVRHVTASGLRVLARHAEALRAQGGGLTLVGCPPRMRVCVEMLGLAPLFAAVCARAPCL